MQVAIPAEVGGERLIQNLRGMRSIHRCVVFKTFFANNLQELLQSRHLDDRTTTKRIEGVVNKLAISNIRANNAVAIVRRNSRITERTGWGTSGDRSVSIFRSECRCEDLGIRHLNLSKEAFGPVAAVK